MPCVLCHGLCLTPCPVCCVTACAWLHVRVPFHISHFASCMPSLILDIYLVFKIIYPKFLWLTNRYPYFPFLLDIKSLTLLVYVQFLSNSIPLSPTSSLILDISCCFLIIMSNFHQIRFPFLLHYPWFWIFPAIFSWLCPISILLNYFFTCSALHFGYSLLFSHDYVQFPSC